MDRVRFGRALGVGARAAAKSLISAAEAAAAPAPEAPAAPRAPVERPAPTRPVASRVSVPPPKAVKHQAGRLKKSVWNPFAKFTSVLWLEVTGLFFAIFALIAGQQVWKWRAAVRQAPATPDAQRLYLYIGLLALFGYFAVSSFVRASRRQRR